MHINALIFLWGNEIVLCIVLVAARLIVHISRKSQKVSFLAVNSCLCGVLNPYVVHEALSFLGVQTLWRVYSPTSYLIPLFSVISGHIALRRIRKATRPLTGKTLAWCGLFLGYAWIAGSLVFYLLLAHGLSGLVG
jgi:hypothetical protein